MNLLVSHLSKAFDGLPVLREVSFAAESGITCIAGPSGAGKTTLLRLILGLERPDGGTVSGTEHARFSAVFQEDRLLAERSAWENLRFVLGPAYEESAAAGLFAALGLPEGGDGPVREFSGGMRRRVALARALLAPFDLLVLDEPFTGLDAENRARAMACIRRAGAEKTVLLAGHEFPEAAPFAAQTVLLPAAAGFKA